MRGNALNYSNGLRIKGMYNKRVHLTAIPLRPSALLHSGK